MNVQRRTSNVQRRSVGDGRARAEDAYDLEERLLEYGARIIRLVEALPRTGAGRHRGDQLLRSGTSPLLNHGEAQAAESRRDFIHKLRLCLKELRESHRTLRLIHRVPMIKPAKKLEPMLQETDELIRIFFTSVSTALEYDPGRRASSAFSTSTLDVGRSALDVHAERP